MTSSGKLVQHKSGRERLTDKRVEKLTGEAGKRIEIFDAIVRELSIRIGKSGKKSWSVMYRIAGEGGFGRRGKQRRMSLGAYPLVPLSDARDRARDALDMADRGLDPSLARATEIDERHTRTFEAALERFVALHVKPNTKDGRRAVVRAQRARKEAGHGASVKSIGRAPAERLLFEHVEPKWRGRMLDSITRADANKLLDEIVTENGVAIAREVRKHLAGMLNWCADRGLIAVNPIAGLRRNDLRYQRRERVLSMDELQRVWDAANKLGYPFGEYIQLLFLTGQRRSEIAGIRRAWIDPIARAIEIPAEHYKTGREHVVPLSATAWTLIESLPQWNDGDFVFTTTAGFRPISGFAKAKARIDDTISQHAKKHELEPLEPWTLHDLRRSAATHMARLGVHQEHIERVLGHVVAGIAGTYNRYSYLDEKRSALELWGRHWKLPGSS
jgi:integrase